MPNTLTAYTPEIWSQNGVLILREKIVMPKLVRRDFSTDLAQAGDTVNTRKPAKMTADDVNPTTGVSVMNVSATNIPVTLNKHKHTTFQLTDREASRSFKNLAEQFLDPAMLALANVVDSDLLGLYADVSTSVVTAASAGGWKTYVNQARTMLNRRMCPESGRHIVLSDDDEGALSNLDLLVQANTAGTDRTLRQGYVGEFKGFQVHRASNVVRVGSPATRKNLAFHPDAFTLVTRVPGTATGRTPGAEQSVGIDKDAGLAIRTTVSYNSTLLGTQITCDILYGVKTLDELCAALLNSSYS